MSQNPHPPHTSSWYLREATNWAETAESVYDSAENADSVEQIQQAHAAAAIAQVHATIGLALTHQHAVIPLP